MISRGEVAPKPTNWQELYASCPIGGWRLDSRGIVDARSGKLVTVEELRAAINEVARIEGCANFAADTRLGGTIMRRLATGCEIIGPISLFCFAGFFAFYKVPKAFQQAFPRNSVMMRKYYATRLSQKRMEELCVQRSVVLNATNPSVIFLLGCSVACFAAATYLWSMKRPVTTYDLTTSSTIRYSRHTENALKWLYAVYYHHPAYTSYSQDSPTIKWPVALSSNSPNDHN